MWMIFTEQEYIELTSSSSSFCVLNLNVAYAMISDDFQKNVPRLGAWGPFQKYITHSKCPFGSSSNVSPSCFTVRYKFLIQYLDLFFDFIDAQKHVCISKIKFSHLIPGFLHCHILSPLIYKNTHFDQQRV